MRRSSTRCSAALPSAAPPRNMQPRRRHGPDGDAVAGPEDEQAPARSVRRRSRSRLDDVDRALLVVGVERRAGAGREHHLRVEPGRLQVSTGEGLPNAEPAISAPSTPLALDAPAGRAASIMLEGRVDFLVPGGRAIQLWMPYMPPPLPRAVSAPVRSEWAMPRPAVIRFMCARADLSACPRCRGA